MVLLRKMTPLLFNTGGDMEIYSVSQFIEILSHQVDVETLQAAEVFLNNLQQHAFSEGYDEGYADCYNIG